MEIVKKEKFYFTGKPCKRGHLADRYTCNNECVECRKEKNVLLKDKQQEWSLKNREHKNAVNRIRYNNNIETERQRSRIRWLTSPEKVRASKKAWESQNPGIRKYYSALRRSRIKQRTPLWANLKEIKLMYMNCPSGYHVDHIIPIKGKLVSGLHVENNLQYLLSTENQRKFNHFKVE